MATIVTDVTPIVDGAGKLVRGHILFEQTDRYVADGVLVTTAVGRVAVRSGEILNPLTIPETPDGAYVRVTEDFERGNDGNVVWWTHIPAGATVEYADLPQVAPPESALTPPEWATELFELVGSIEAVNDPVVAALLDDPASASAVAAVGLLGNTVSAASYGVVGDGVADDTTALQAALHAVPDNGTLVIPAGTYKLSGEINNVTSGGVAKSVRVSAYGATFVQTANQISVDFAGGWDTTVSVSALAATTITEAAVTNQGVQLTVSGTMPWQRGDLVKVWADNVLPDSQWDIPSPAASSGRVGQFFTVYSVASNTVILQGKLRDPMTTGIKVARMRPVTAVWEGGTFDVSAAYLSGSFAQPAFRYAAMRGPVVRDVRIARSGGPAFSMVSNYGYRIENSEGDWAWNDAATHFGYGVDDNTSWYGVVDGCRFHQPRHGYSTTASTTTVGQDAPNIHGRTFGARVVNTVVDSPSSTAFDAHSNGNLVSFENCVAINAVYGFSLRGQRNSVLNCTIRDCASGIRFASDSAAGESYGHIVDGLRVEGTTGVLFEVAVRHGGGHPNTGVHDARPLQVRNVHARNVVGQGFNILNGTIVAENVHIEYSGAVAAVGNTITNSFLRGANVRLDYFDTTGSGQDVFSVSNTATSLLEVDGLRVQGFSSMSTRLARVVTAGALSVVRVKNCVIDYAPGTAVHTPTSEAGWFDYQVAVGAAVKSSAYLPMVDADVVSTTAVGFVAKTTNPVVTIVANLTGANRTLANLPIPLVQGQTLVVVNASAAFTLTITHGASPRTSLTGGTNKVLSAGQSIQLVANDAGVWRQVTPI